MIHLRPGARPRACTLALVAALALGSASPSPAAGPATAEIALAPSQAQALGITATRLGQPGAVRGMPYPARVTVPPAREQVVSAPLDGAVERLLVSGQESIRAGQPLLRLASPGWGELQLKLVEAAGREKLAQRTLQRERQLVAEGIVPERRVLEAETAAQAEAARLRQARSELRLAGADAALLQRLANGGAPDDTMVVRAREPGVVTGLEVKPGQRVHQADPLVRLADVRELWLEIEIPADRPAPTGEITVVGRDAAATPLSTGAVLKESQTLTVRARVTRGAGTLRAGELVQAQVPLPAAAGWTLPLQAVTRHENRDYVFVRTAGGYTPTPVTVAASAGSQVQVAGPLQAGQEVASSGIAALKAAWLGQTAGR